MNKEEQDEKNQGREGYKWMSSFVHKTQVTQRVLNYFVIWEIWTIAPGDGTPLQYSCLENPMDGEAW